MPQLIPEYTSDFSVGMVDDVAATRYPSAAAAQILNGRLQADGTVRRRPGTIRTSAAAPKVDIGYGATEFRLADGTDLFIVINGDSSFESSDFGATWSAALATGLRADYWSFATMRVGASNFLFACNGGSAKIQRYDGTTWDTLVNGPSGAKFLAVFNGRLYATGHNGQQVQASKIADPTTWTVPDGLSLQIITHNGNDPTGLYQIGPHLLIFDREGTSYIDGFGQQTIIVAAGATGFSRSVGCVAFRSIVGVGDNAICWLSDRGIEYYSPGIGILLVSKGIQTFMQDLDWSQLLGNPGRPSGAYDDINQDYFLAVPTNGTRNNRTAVVNLRKNVLYQRPGPKAAATIDRQLSTVGGNLLFSGDVNGYLTALGGGFESKADNNGYWTLVTEGEGGDLLSDDGNGYLQVETDDALPATFFTAPISDRPCTLHSVGYDGFVRKHDGVNSDDLLSDSTGGIAVTMTMVSRPFFQRWARQRKKSRVIHVKAISDVQATLELSVRANGTASAQKTMTIPATAFNQGKRRREMISMIGDAPQVELRSTDDIRVSLIGLSAQLLRERVG